MPDENPIEDIQVQLSHLEHQVEELNGQVIKQWQAIDALTRKVDQAVSRLGALVETLDSRS